MSATRRAAIAGTGSYVPERILSNADLERMVDTTDAWIMELTGIRERRIAAPEETSSTMAVIAAGTTGFAPCAGSQRWSAMAMSGCGSCATCPIAG